MEHPQANWHQQGIGINGIGEFDLLVDAIIGYRLMGDPRAPASEWIREANKSQKPILALDAPSGLDSTTGQPSDPCIRATATLTLALPKAGLLSEGAREVVGELFLADIGVPWELYASMGLRVPALFGVGPILQLS